MAWAIVWSRRRCRRRLLFSLSWFCFVSFGRVAFLELRIPQLSIAQCRKTHSSFVVVVVVGDYDEYVEQLQ